jgi:lipoprotein-releasing system permease protein
MKSLNAVEGATDEGDRKKGIEEIREMTAPQELVVKGIFDSGNWDFDATVVFVHLETAQVLYGFDLDECHGIAARTEDPFKADQLQAKLHEILPQQFAVRTWAQINKTIFDAVAAERQMMFLILFIIMIVGSFGIMSTMITVTVQKRTEIGILKALGSREGQIAWVFLFQGILVGLVGVFAGFGLAQLTIWKRNDIAGWVGQRFGVEFFNAEMYKIDGGIPSVQTPADLTVITISALVCCTLAALVPAFLAAFLQPAKALRSQ